MSPTAWVIADGQLPAPPPPPRGLLVDVSLPWPEWRRVVPHLPLDLHALLIEEWLLVHGFLEPKRRKDR